MPTVTRVIVMRHGHRHASDSRVPRIEHDPQLTAKGQVQAQQVATLLQQDRALTGGGGISAIFCSPFVRAIQTAAPLAEALQLPVHVDRGFGEIMPEPLGSPLGCLMYDTQLPGSLPLVPPGVVVADSGSPQPPFPDIDGPEYYRQGDTGQRARTVRRHREGLERCFAAVEAASAGQDNDRAATILVVAHGCSSDFVGEALCGNRFPSELHTARDGPAVPHVALTTLRRDDAHSRWEMVGFAVPTVSTENSNGGDGDAAEAADDTAVMSAACPTKSEERPCHRPKL
jgi:broad specificity phosphatase PhoE